MKLYEILYEINTFFDNEDNFDIETGEIINFEELEELKLARDTKIENIALFIKNLKAEEAMVKAEKLTLEKRQKQLNNKSENVTKYLQSCLRGEKFKTGKVDISYRKSTAVRITDISKIDETFLKYAEPTVDKVKLKEFLKNDPLKQGVDGAELLTNANMTIR